MKITKQELREFIKEEVARFHMEESKLIKNKSKERRQNIEKEIEKGLESGKYDEKRAKEIRDAFRVWNTYSEKYSDIGLSFHF